MSRKPVSVSSFVETLRSFESEPITKVRLLDYCSSVAVERGSLDRFLHFRDDAYTRNLIHRDEAIEIMAVCWQPGQRTVIHTHNGQLGWMGVEQGALAIVNYKYLSCNAPENQNVAGLDCLAGATELDLDRREVQECYAGGPVSTVDKEQTIHQVVVQGKEPVVSIHIYSRPIDSCVAFDLKEKRCYRRQLSFYSRHGEVVMSEADLLRAQEPTPALVP
jgi:cysteine dioxygenase